MATLVAGYPCNVNVGPKSLRGAVLDEWEERRWRSANALSAAEHASWRRQLRSGAERRCANARFPGYQTDLAKQWTLARRAWDLYILQEQSSRYTQASLPAYGATPDCDELPLNDTPLDYTSTETFARAAALIAELTVPGPTPGLTSEPTCQLSILPEPTPISPFAKLDPSASYRQHAKKKKKAAAFDWNEPEKKEEGAAGGDGGEDNNANGNSGGGDAAGGAGGGEDPNEGGGGGGGGDDDGDGDDWFGGGSKKKKDKKKKKGAADPAEDEKKEEDDPNALSWADETNNAANDDDWGFSAATAKKDKKKKGKKDEPEEKKEEKSASTFDDINLLDDSSAPKIDLSFDSGNQDTSGGFSFGGWGGGGWGSAAKKTASSWLGGGDSANDVSEVKEDNLDTSWGIGSGKKKDKKAGGFDFGDFGADTTQDDSKQAEDDTWGNLTSTASKKDKKKKKGAIEEVKEEPVVAVAETTDAAEDTWGAWGATAAKKDSKKKKKGAAIEEDPVPPPPPPEPEAPPEDDAWGNFTTTTSKKDSKKKKKGAIEEVKEEAPIVALVDEDKTGGQDDTWGSWGGTTSSDKKKKKGTTALDDLLAEDPKPKKEKDDLWGAVGTSKDKKKKAVGKKGAVEETKAEDDWDAWGSKTKSDQKSEPLLEDDPIVDVVDGDGNADSGWMGWATGGSKKTKGKKDADEKPPSPPPAETEPVAGKKDKKKKKSMWDMDEPEALPAEEPPADDGWGTAAKKDKKGSKKSIWGMDEAEPEPEALPEPEPEVDPLAGLTGAKRRKKEKELAKKKADEEAEAERLKAEEERLREEEEQKLKAEEEEKQKLKAEEEEKKSSSTKKDKKGKKSKKDPEPDPEPEPTALPELSPVDDSWGGDGWGSTDKKKKKGKKDDPIAEVVPEPEPEPAAADTWGTWGATTSTDKKKKKSKKDADPIPEPPKDPEPEPAAADDSWGIWGGAKTDKTKDKDKKKDKKKGVFDFDDAPPPAPTPPAMGLTPEPSALDDDTWGGLMTSSKSKKDKKTKKSDPIEDLLGGLSSDKADASFNAPAAEERKEEIVSAAKAARSFWGTMSGTGTTAPPPPKLTKKEREREEMRKKAAEEEAAAQAAEETNANALIDLMDDVQEETPPPKASSKSKSKDKERDKDKDKKSSKSSKVEEKAPTDEKKKKKTDLDALLDLDEPSPPAEKSRDTQAKADPSGDAAWSFWGSSKKTSGKKDKEIVKSELANEEPAAADVWNPPEDVMAADEVTPVKTKSSSKSKSSGMSSWFGASGDTSIKKKAVGDKSSKSKKAIEEQADAEFEPQAPPPLDLLSHGASPDPDLVAADPQPPASKKTSKSSKAVASSPPKSSDKKKKSSKDKDKDSATRDLLLEVPEDTVAHPPSPVPGSFPADYFDNAAADDAWGDADKPKKKSSSSKDKKEKPATKLTKEKKTKMDSDLIYDDEPMVGGPPTPPPELADKPAKKERTKIKREEVSSGWGRSGASATKKLSKARDEADVASPPREKPSMSRSKSSKTPREKEREEARSKSSTSDKERTRAERPKAEKRSSFAGFFGGSAPAPPPARIKSSRRHSDMPKSTHRNMNDAGLPSPPPDEMPDKAAKFFGGGEDDDRKKKRSKGKVPDPYPIDDDDMVLVNPIEDPIINAPIPEKKSKREKSSRTKSKRESKYVDAEDIIMVDNGSGGSPDVVTGPEGDVGYVEKGSSHRSREREDRPRLKRSGTSRRKADEPAETGLKGLFRFGKKDKEEKTARARSRAVSGEDAYGGSRRKRTDPTRDDDAKRLRREERRLRRDKTEQETDAPGLTDAAPAMETEAEDTMIAQHREWRKQVKAGAMDDETYRKLVASARSNAAREREGKETRKPRDREDKEKSSSRRYTGRTRDTDYDTAADDARARRHKAERRRSTMDAHALPTRTADEEAERRARRAARASRKGETQPVADVEADNARYDDSRRPPFGANKGGDKTRSWVDSLDMEQPDAPPVQGTVLDEPDADAVPLEEDEAVRRRKRKEAKRRMRDEEEAAARDEMAERREKRSSRRERDPYEKQRSREPSAMAGTGKRTSWLKKLGM